MSDQGHIAPPPGFTPINLNQSQPAQQGQPEPVKIPLTNQPPVQQTAPAQTAPAQTVTPQVVQPPVQPQVITIGAPPAMEAQTAQPQVQTPPAQEQPQVTQPPVQQPEQQHFVATPQENWQPPFQPGAPTQQPQVQQPQVQQPPVQQPQPSLSQPIQQAPMPQFQQPQFQPQFAGQPQFQPPAQFQQPGMPAQPARRTLASFETTLDDDALDSVEYFPKLNDKQLARVCFTMFKPDGGARMLSFHKYWAPKLKRSILCPKEEDDASMAFKQLAESEFGAPKHSIITIVFFYDIFPHNGQVIPRMATNGQPEIDPQTGAAIPSGRLMIWRISREKVPMIRQISREYPMSSVDLNIQCTEPNFQKFSITNGRQRIIGAYPSLLAQIEAKSKEMWDYELIKSIPPTITYQELQQLVMQNRQIGGATFGQPGGALVDPFAASHQGFPSPAVGAGSPVYVGPQTGLPPTGFGDLIAKESQNYIPPQGS